jgi:hypothetical protein
MCDADTEANVVPEATPLAGQGSDGLAEFKRREHGLERPYRRRTRALMRAMLRS